MGVQPAGGSGTDRPPIAGLGRGRYASTGLILPQITASAREPLGSAPARAVPPIPPCRPVWRPARGMSLDACR